MNFTALLESLTDFFARQHHHPDLARERAETIVYIVKQHMPAQVCILGERCVHRMEGDDDLSEQASHFTP